MNPWLAALGLAALFGVALLFVPFPVWIVFVVVMLAVVRWL